MYTIIDVETTGGSPLTDRVIDIAIFVHDGEQVIEQFSSLVNPQREILPWVSNLTGITQEMVDKAPLFKDIQERVFELTADRIFVAHNVQFDFGMIRHEFKRIGIDYTRRKLDTVNLARKVIPGYSSYSLGTLCDLLGIVIEDRHRASGDAEATVKLFEMILAKQQSAKHIEVELNHGLDLSLLPASIPKSAIELLPEEPGVLYFKDSNDKILFLEGVKNVRKRVIAEITKMSSTPKGNQLLERLHDIDFEPAGNELIARLLALQEYKMHQPEFNKKIREAKTTFGIFIKVDEHGFKYLKVLPINDRNTEPVLQFSNKAIAQKILTKISNDHKLFVQYSLLKQQPTKAFDADFKLAFNRKVEDSVRKFGNRSSNYFIIGEAVRPEEKSVVWVEAGLYKGFGYFDPEFVTPTPANLSEIIRPAEDDQEAQKIIRLMLRKDKKVRLVNY